MNGLIPVRLLVVDDHALFRRALMQPLQASPLIDLVGTAPDGEFALQMCRSVETAPEVLLLDLHMPHSDGFDVMTRLHAIPVPPRCLILTGDDNPQSILRAFQAGAAGYMLKDNVTDESLISSVLAVANGGSYLDSQLLQELLNVEAQLRLITPDAAAMLSPDEESLLRDVGLGLDNKLIASRHAITTKTVSNRLSLLYTKIKVQNRVQAAFYALQTGAISLDEVLAPKEQQPDA